MNVCDDINNMNFLTGHTLSDNFTATVTDETDDNTNITIVSVDNSYQRKDSSFDSSDTLIEDSGEQCFGKRSDMERVLDDRCYCLRSKCLHLSGTLLFMGITCVLLVFFLRNYLKEMLEWLQSLNGWISGLMFVLLFTIVSFPMTWGYIALNLACGYLYGFFMGLFTVIISVGIGVVVSLFVCRKFIKNLIQSKLQSEHLKAIIRVVESRRGFKVVVLTRLTPIPFGLQNGLFAITNMRIYKCLLASLIGLLPTQTLNTYIGSSLRTMEDVLKHHSIGDYFLLLIQLGISAFLMWYVIRRARYELNKACLPQSASDVVECDDNVGVRCHSYFVKNSSEDWEGHNYAPIPERDLVFIAAKEQKKKIKPGHKRAHSASAVLYALQNIDMDTE